MAKNDYQRGRARGMELARSIWMKKGLEALRNDITFRKASGIDTDVFTETVDRAANEIKGCVLESVICIVLVALRDEFGYGHKRAKEVYDEWAMQKERYMKMDIMSWFFERLDMIKKLDITQLKLEFEFGKPRKRTEYERGRLDGMELALRFLMLAT